VICTPRKVTGTRRMGTNCGLVLRHCACTCGVNQGLEAEEVVDIAAGKTSRSDSKHVVVFVLLQ